MNSKERKERRFQNRRAKRKKKEVSFSMLLDPKIYFDAFEKCKQKVAWKFEVIKYEISKALNILELIRKLKNGIDVREPFHCFSLSERGKRRDIKALTFSERVAQRGLCDTIISPILTNSLIYDNGASQEGKGIDFARKRFVEHLRRFAHKHGNNGYIVLIDYSKYFENIDHELLKKTVIDKHFKDEELRNYIFKFVEAFEKGLGLGSQVAQTLAVTFVNKVDQFAKTVLGLKYYGRYMDDSYFIAKTYSEAKNNLMKLCEVCKDLKISVNLKKTKIIPLKQYFTFLQGRYTVTDSGKILAKCSKNSIKREKKKLKKLFKYSKEHNLDTENLLNMSYVSWRGSFKRFRAFRQVASVRRYKDSLLKS